MKRARETESEREQEKQIERERETERDKDKDSMSLSNYRECEWVSCAARGACARGGGARANEHVHREVYNRMSSLCENPTSHYFYVTAHPYKFLLPNPIRY